MIPEEALRRAENLSKNEEQIFTTQEARRIIEGLLEMLDHRSVDARMREILRGEKE